MLLIGGSSQTPAHLVTPAIQYYALICVLFTESIIIVTIDYTKYNVYRKDGSIFFFF